MKVRLADVAEAYAIWNVPHFVPIEDFADFTLLRHAVVFYDPPWVLYEKNFSSVGHQGDGSASYVPWGGNLEKDLL